jgi:hypothetical protein
MAHGGGALASGVHLLGSVFLNVGGFVVFITTFFFYLGAWIETQALESQISEITATFVASAGVVFLGQTKLILIRDTLQQLSLPNMAAEDAASAQKNASLQTAAFQVMYPLGCGLIVLGAATIFVGEAAVRRRAWQNAATSVGVSVLMAVLMVLVIFATEVAFTLLISKRYQTVSAAWVKQQVVQTLIDGRLSSRAA